ncbi:MAG: hypothetical protein M3R51_11115 [Candidatus Eremiobacteraeota bacterium]|nr:hypothetical protein [Candidatus Eremiobacteraeota bacterium]
MQRLFSSTVSRATIVNGLFADSDIAAIASEHGVEREKVVSALCGDEASTAGERLREAVLRMREAAAEIPSGVAFPASLDGSTDGGMELVGLFVNPLMTTAMILDRPVPQIADVARSIDPKLSLAAYASRVFRVLAVQMPQLATPLTNAARALEHA